MITKHENPLHLLICVLIKYLIATLPYNRVLYFRGNVGFYSRGLFQDGALIVGFVFQVSYYIYRIFYLKCWKLFVLTNVQVSFKVLICVLQKVKADWLIG